MRWLPFWAAFAVALAMRLAFLTDRPLHHDEGVAAWQLYRMLDGYQYAYDPGRFHGPFLVACALPFIYLFGESVVGLRLPVALASAFMLPLLLPLRRWLGVAGVTAAAWLLALSPAFVSYGRDLIHESFLVLLTLALVVAVALWLEERRERFLILAALCLGLLATVKETYVLTLAVLGVAAVLAAAWAPGSPRLRELRGALPPRAILRAGAALAGPYVLLYTSFFTHPRGLVDSFRSFFLWAEKGVAGAGHGKPWDYFFRLLASFETLIAICAISGAWLAVRRRDAFGTFCALWAAGGLAAYSVLRYKTPWLALNFLLPAALAGGVLFREAFERPRPGALRAGLAALFAVGLAWSAGRAVEVSFLRFDDDGLSLAYVPTHRDVEVLLSQVRATVRKAPPGEPPELRIIGQHAWPLPWYLRDLGRMEYLREVPPSPDADVLIVESAQEARVRARLRQRYRVRRYQLRPRKWVGLYVNERLFPASP